MRSGFPLEHSELNEFQLYCMLCMKRCQLLRAGFLFQRQISKRNSQKLLCAFAFTAFYFGAVVLNPDSNEPHVFLPAVCSGKDLADLCHTGSFCVKQKPSELLSRGPRATDHEPKSKCLLLLPCLVAPNTEAAGGWSVY